MSQHDVVFAAPILFWLGKKFTIASGPRYGDWEVIGVTDTQSEACVVR